MPTRRSDVAEIERFVEEASDEAVHLAAAVLREDAVNVRWRAQLGPCLTQRAVADLLGMTTQGVAKRARGHELVRLTHRDGRPVYPLFQFDGRSVLNGLGQVLDVLYRVDDPLTAASWLTLPKRSLGGRSPMEMLRAGDVEAVVAAAAHYLARSS